MHVPYAAPYVLPYLCHNDPYGLVCEGAYNDKRMCIHRCYY